MECGIQSHPINYTFYPITTVYLVIQLIWVISFHSYCLAHYKPLYLLLLTWFPVQRLSSFARQNQDLLQEAWRLSSCKSYKLHEPTTKQHHPHIQLIYISTDCPNIQNTCIDQVVPFSLSVYFRNPHKPKRPIQRLNLYFSIQNLRVWACKKLNSKLLPSQMFSASVYL